MTILEFCSVRNIQTQRVLKYIQRNPELFEGHIDKKGQSTELDDVALALLEEKYHLAPEVVPEQQLELLKRLEVSQQFIIQLQQDIIKKDSLLLEVSGTKLLLEEKSSQLEQANGKNAELEASLSELERKNAELQAKLQEAEQEKEKLKNRSFFQRLFNTD